MRKKGIIVCDIDGTLLNSPDGVASVLYTKDGVTKKLTGEEFAAWNEYEEHPERYDFSEFDDEEKAWKSIVEGKPINENVRFVYNLVTRKGYDFCVLSARHCEDTVRDAIGAWAERYMPGSSVSYRKDLSFCVNDSDRDYESPTTSGRKRDKLLHISSFYRNVIFIDDDQRNIDDAEAIGNPRIRCVKAKKFDKSALNIVYTVNNGQT